MVRVSPISFNKPPLTFIEQVQKLKKRGMQVPDEHKAAFYLSQINYDRFTAYCLPFEQNQTTHLLRQGTRFDDVLKLYIFDRELRLLILDVIERFEVSIRTQMAYHLSRNHNTAHPHLIPQIFKKQQVYNDSIIRLANDIKNSKEGFIKHLTSRYEEDLPPIWASVELMTIGQLSKWYSNIKSRADRQSIASIYQVDEKILTSLCQHLTHVRNYSAHHARLWNRGFTLTMAIPRKGPDTLISGLDSTQLQSRSQRKLYNTLVMLIHLMNVMNPGHHWQQRLQNLIQHHKVDTSKMGFPADWLEREIWS